MLAAWGVLRVSRPRVSVFLAVSLDGFIAREDGGIDWLTAFESPGVEDYGFKEFFDSIDVLIMGRNTYEVVLGLDPWPYGDKSLIVLTHRELTPLHNETAYSGSLSKLVQKLGGEGVRRIYLDGGNSIRQGLAEGLVDDMTLSWIPVTLGKGISLFGAEVPEVRWTLESVKEFSKTMVQTRYVMK